jgi:muconolactone D-isomerase
MDVRVPHDVDPAPSAAAEGREKAKARDLRRSGKWRHLWRVAGHYSNISVFDVDGHDELHAILIHPAAVPFMQMTVTPLARHPSAID